MAVARTGGTVEGVRGRPHEIVRLGLNYDNMAPGLSQFIHDAILADCHRGTRSAAR